MTKGNKVWLTVAVAAAVAAVQEATAAGVLPRLVVDIVGALLPLVGVV